MGTSPQRRSGGISGVTNAPLPWNNWLACYPALTLALAGTLEHGAAIMQKHGRASESDRAASQSCGQLGAPFATPSWVETRKGTDTAISQVHDRPRFHLPGNNSSSLRKGPSQLSLC